MLSTYIIVDSCINALVGLFAMIANGLIIYIYVKKKELHTVNNHFLIQLAVIDLIKAIFIQPFKAFFQVKDGVILSGFYCPMSGFIMTITTVLSPFLLAAIAVVRYYKIVQWPKFNHVFTTTKVKLYSAMMILATTILALLPLVGEGQYTFTSYHGICFAKFSSKNMVFRVMLYFYVIGISLPILVFCYARIFHTLRVHSRRVSSHMKRQRPSQGYAEEQHDVSGHDASEGSNIKSSAVTTTTTTITPPTTTTATNDVSSSSQGRLHRQSSNETYQPRGKATENCIDGVQHDNGSDAAESTDVDKEWHLFPFPTGTSNVSSSLNSEGNAADTEGKEIVNAPDQEVDRKADGATGWEKGVRHRQSARDFHKTWSAKEIHVTKVMFVIVLVFLILWIPALLINVLLLSKLATVPAWFIYFIITLGNSKILLNPLIYGLWNNQFRDGLKELLIKLRSSICKRQP